MTRATQIILVAALVLGLTALALELVDPTRVTWNEHVLANPPGASVTALAAKPSEPDTRLVGTTLGLFLTNDRGRTWQRADLPSSWCAPASQLLFDTADPDTAYALGTFGLGISRDGGETWDVASPPPGADAYLGLAQHPVDGALYILAHNGLLRSDDRGGTWHALPLPSNAPRLRAVAPHPNLSGALIAGTERGFLFSTDAGATWVSPAGSPSESVDWLALQTDTDGRLLAYASTGSYQSVDGGASWQVVEDVFSVETCLAQTGLDPADSGAYASWVARSPEPGALPNILDGSLTAVSAAGPGRQVGLAATLSALYETLDSGVTWAPWETALPAAPVALLASSPADSSRLYAATPYGISVSLDGARSWQSPVEVRQDLAFRAAAMAVDPGNALRAYMLTQTGTVYQSNDGGQTWTLHSAIAESLRPGSLSLVIVAPSDGPSVPCLLSDRLYCSSGDTDDAVWVAADLTGSDTRPVALISSRKSVTVLITRDGTIYRSSGPALTEWNRIGGGAALDGDVSAVWRPTDGDSLNAVTVSGTFFTSSGDGWRLLRNAPESMEGTHQITLTSAPGSARPMVIASGERGIALWGRSGMVGIAESACPASVADAQLITDTSPDGGAFRISDDGALSHIDIDLFTSGQLTPWLAALSGLCALGGLCLWRRTRPWSYRERRHAAARKDTLSPRETSVDAPLVARKPTLDRAHAPAQTTTKASGAAAGHPKDAGTLPLSGTPMGVTKPSEVSEGPLDGLDSQGLRLVRQLCERLGLQILTERTQGALTGYMLDASKLRLSLPESLPLVVAPGAQIEPLLANKIKTLAAAMGAVSPFTLAVLLGQESDSPDATEASRMGASQSAKGLIALTTQDVAHILDADEPRSALASLVQRTVPLGQISPFVQSGPVPRTMFFGRDYEIKALLRTLYDRSVAVVGARKIGKTSFLGLVHQRLLQNPELLPVYVDCHHVTDDVAFLRALSLMGDVPVESASVDVLRRVVMRLRGRQGSSGQTVVLELDEVDNLLRYDLVNELRILRIFRSLSDEGLCRFVLCGERVLDAVVRDAALPLQAFCSTLRLGYLAPEDAQKLVREPLASLGIALQDPDRLSADIVGLSGRHPNILQAICQLLVERVADRPERIVLNDDLDAVRQSAAFRDLFFEVSWGNATTLERLISVLMAQKEQFGIDQVRLALEAHGIRIAEGELSSALEGLILTSLITPHGAGYAFTSDAFPRVLGETGFAQGFRESLTETLLEEQSGI